MEPYWDQNGHAPHPIKYESEAAVSGFPYCTESSLNFSTSGTPYSEDDTEYAPGRRNKTSRQDPLSHRIIEKRRRDRMNSCLADLSRLIPPQYQRKGRGRIEKTEIIEMAIRHLKHLQNECVHKDIEYKLGYSDCMKEAAKFLYESHMQDCCYRLIAHLQEHCDEVLKGECFKNRCNVETISASSGSPAQNTNYHNASSVPLSQLRDMLTSDVEHSNDNNDIKDLSFRNHHHHQSHQAPVITSTAPSSICHDSSNHDFDSSRDISHHENELSSPPPLHHHLHHIHSLVNQQQQHNSGTTSSVSVTPHHHLMENGTKVNGGGSNNNGSIISSGGAGGGITLKTIRMRNFSESSHDIENNNNNYKYKNHIKERFNHDAHLNDESTSEDHSIPPTINITERTSPIIITEKPLSNKLLDSSNNETTLKKRKLDSNKEDNNVNNANTITNNNNINNSKNNNNNSNNNKNINNTAINDIKIEPSSPQINSNSIKNPNNINNGVGGRHFPVPIFALHGQGTYYVPLNIDYDSLLPYLNGIDLLDKNFCPIQMLHPVNINVNFTIPTTSSQTFSGITRPVGLPTAAILPRSKIEKLSNGW